MDQRERELREDIIRQCLWMNDSGLNQGTSGNISVRFEDRMLITPSATPYEAMRPDMIASMPLDGDGLGWDGPLKPSSEWRFHRDILNSDAAVHAVVHTHSTFATVLSMLRRDIPACHYMIAVFGGSTVRCADYATFGTAELSQNALDALKDRSACLLGTHGQIATGETLDKAMWRAAELETLAMQYYHAALLGDPVILNKNQMAEVQDKFAGYGLKD